MWAYRGELTGARRWLVWFTIPSIAGGAFGAWLLLHTSAHRFGAIVPFFMLGATVLFVGQRPLTRWLSPGRVESGSTGQLDTAWRARCGMALAPRPAVPRFATYGNHHACRDGGCGPRSTPRRVRDSYRAWRANSVCPEGTIRQSRRARLPPARIRPSTARTLVSRPPTESRISDRQVRHGP